MRETQNREGDMGMGIGRDLGRSNASDQRNGHLVYTRSHQYKGGQLQEHQMQKKWLAKVPTPHLNLTRNYNTL